MTAIPKAVAATLLACSLACSDSSGPDQATNAFHAQLDTQAWSADTAVAIMFAAPTDTTLSIAGARTLGSTEEQQIGLALHGFTGAGQVTLGDSTAQGIGAFSIFQVSGGVVVSTRVYRSRAAIPGQVNITSINRVDSTVSGTFSFEAALTPDTAPHRHLSGSFRLRFEVVPVYTVP